MEYMDEGTSTEKFMKDMLKVLRDDGFFKMIGKDKERHRFIIALNKEIFAIGASNDQDSLNDFFDTQAHNLNQPKPKWIVIMVTRANLCEVHAETCGCH